MNSDRPSHNLRGLGLDLARQIDEVCLRFEAEWRLGRQPLIEIYLVEVSDEGQPALRVELEALERELRRSDGTASAAVPGPSTTDGVPTPRSIAHASTMGPAESPTARASDSPPSSVAR